MSDTVKEKNGNPVRWDWIPLIRVGPLRFGASKHDVQQLFELKNEEWDQDKESVSYDIDELDGYLTFYDDRLASICLYANAWYKGVEIIGLTMREFESVLGIEHTSGDNTFLLDDGSEMTHYEWEKPQILASVTGGVIDSYSFSNFDL